MRFRLYLAVTPSDARVVYQVVIDEKGEEVKYLDAESKGSAALSEW